MIISFDTANSAAVRVVQAGLGVQTDGIWGPITDRVWNTRTRTERERIIRMIIDRATELGASKQQIAYMLATAEHETGGSMLPNVESLGYTSAGRIRQVWPSRFPTEESAQAYIRSPKALANFVYNGRMGNRTGSDDGWVYRGRGLAQITGRDNYRRLGQRIGVDLESDPDKALEPAIAVDLLVIGSIEGLYTGHRLDRHVNRASCDYREARRVINGLDRAGHIAGLATGWERKLT